MEKWECTACGYIYDPEKGDPENGINPGTSFEDLPDDDPQVRYPDVGVAMDLLGWRPHEALKDGLRRTIEYFKSVCL